MLKGCVCDQRTVVQFQNVEWFRGTSTSSKMADAFIRDQLTVGQTLEALNKQREVIFYGVNESRGCEETAALTSFAKWWQCIARYPRVASVIYIKPKWPRLQTGHRPKHRMIFHEACLPTRTLLGPFVLNNDKTAKRKSTVYNECNWIELPSSHFEDWSPQIVTTRIEHKFHLLPHQDMSLATNLL